MDDAKVMTRQTVDGTRYELVTETPYCTRCGREWVHVVTTAEVEVSYYSFSGGRPSAHPVDADPLGDALREWVVAARGRSGPPEVAGSGPVLSPQVRCSEGHEWPVDVWARLAECQPAALEEDEGEAA